MEPKPIYNPINVCRKINGYPCWNGQKCPICVEYFIQLEKYRLNKFKEEREKTICLAQQIRKEKL